MRCKKCNKEFVADMNFQQITDGTFKKSEDKKSINQQNTKVIFLCDDCKLK